jgi:hypothetical protein
MEKTGFRFITKIFAILILAFGFVSATSCVAGTTCGSLSGAAALNCAMCQVCLLVSGLLPIMAFVLFVLSGVVYAMGNFFGAETRAKAIGYAMNMLTGAIIALLISIIGPTIINALLPSTATQVTAGSCDSITWT